MKKIFIPSIIVITLVITGCSQAISTNQIMEKNKLHTLSTSIIFIDKNNTGGPWEGTIDYPFQSISDGINHAENGDIIYVLNGIYYEQLIVDKSLHIIGEDKNNVIVDAEYKENAIELKSDNVKIEQFTIRNTGGYKGNSGVLIQSNNCEVSECVFYRHRIGLRIFNGDDNMVNHCTFHTNGKGIFFEQSTNSEVNNCELAHNGIGAQFDFCDNVKILNSYAHENGVPLLFNVSSSIEIVDSAICDNNDNGGGVFVYNSNDVIVENCNVFHSGAGVKIVNSTQMVFTNCDFQYITHFTFWITDNSKNINISSCNIINNFRHGIHIKDSCCTVTGSNMYNNSIESVHAKNSHVNAKNNWWGNKFGPLFTKGFRIVDTLNRDFGRIKSFPWSSTSFENAGSNWSVEEIFDKTIIHGYGDEPITLSGNDTDMDGVPDWWEQKWEYDPYIWDDHLNLDPDGDALNNFEECYTDSYGSNPFKKDIFLEIDWTVSKTPDASNIPPAEYVEKMKQRFLEHDITLHVDLGELDGGEEIPYTTDFNFGELVDLYWDHFLHNDLNNPRKNIFHYGLICDRGPGNGFAFVGWAHLNSFCISGDELAGKHSILERGWLITCGSMHETGHTLGLIVDDFGGNDNHAAIKPKYSEFWYYRNYKSIMNYRYTYSILDYSDGDNGKVDYNDWENMEFDFFKNTHFEWPKETA